MLTAVLVALAVVVLFLLAYGATRPARFRVERSARLKASPERIFPHLADFHRWGAWSPWEKLDPTMKRTFSGAESGKGAAYAWEGNNKAGQGKMEILEATPAKIVIDLQFQKPFAAHNQAEFSLEPRGEATQISWAMTGRSPFPIRVMSLFFSMDKMVGKDFEAGLANLGAVVEQ
jgi:hypothetical protein